MKNPNHFLAVLSLFIILLCLAAFAGTALGEEVPQNASAFFADRIDQGYSITRWASPSESGYAYAILSKGSENRLFVMRKADNSFVIECTSIRALYQGSFLPKLSPNTDPYFYITYTQENGQREVYHYERDDNGTWVLRAYQTANEDGSAYFFGALTDNKLSYAVLKEDGPGAETIIYGTYQRSLRYLSINALPRTLEEARLKLSNPPKIPQGDFDAINVRFSGGQKYAVYSAPDASSIRGAKGKAAVSTNDWIQVFGEEDGWILIQYDISSTKLRFGYISAEALPPRASVSPLAFIPEPIEILSRTIVTDDPLKSQEQISALLKGQAGCYYLAALNDDWAYIEAKTADGQTYRGFVSRDDIALKRQTLEILKDTAVYGEFYGEPYTENGPLLLLKKGQAGCYYVSVYRDNWVYLEVETNGGDTTRGFVLADDVSIEQRD